MNKLFTIMRESQVARFLIPSGLLIIIFGIIVFFISLNNQNYLKTEATVTNVEVTQEVRTDADGSYIDDIYNVTVTYSVNDRDYTGTLDNVGIHKTGDKMTIYYNPEDPSQITQTKSLIFPIIIIVAGIAALIGGIVSSLKVRKES